MEQVNFMEQFIQMLLDFLRKQAFAVVVLVCCVGGLVWFAKDQKAEFTVQITALQTDLKACAKAREEDQKEIRQLSVELGIVRERVNILSGIPTTPRTRKH